MLIPSLMTALSWASLVFVTIAGLAFVLLPLVLDHAQRSIRAKPPLGPAWARRVWYARTDLYRAIIGIALLIAVATFGLSLL